MVKQNLIFLTINIKKKIFNNRDDSRAEYLKDLKKQKRKYVLKRSFSNTLLSTILGLVFLLVYIAMVLYTFLINNFSNTYLFLSFLIEFIGFAFLLPFFSELKFFNLYYKTRFSILHILHSKKDEKHDLYLQDFQINYNNLRKYIKKRIVSSKGNLLTYDYEVNRILNEIDCFFDSTIKILFRNKIMNIPYLPREEFEKYMEEMEIQHHIDEQRWDDFEQYDEYDPSNYEIKAINFRSVHDFMRIYGKFIIKNPRNESINTVAIAELFRKWNIVVNKIDPVIFDESKRDVKKYYNKKQDRQNYFITKLYEIFIIFLVTIICGLLLHFFV